MPGELAGAQLQIVSRSATRSATPKIEAERGRSATPVFAGALMLWKRFFWLKSERA